MKSIDECPIQRFITDEEGNIKKIEYITDEVDTNILDIEEALSLQLENKLKFMNAQILKSESHYSVEYNFNPGEYKALSYLKSSKVELSDYYKKHKVGNRAKVKAYYYNTLSMLESDTNISAVDIELSDGEVVHMTSLYMLRRMLYDKGFYNLTELLKLFIHINDPRYASNDVRGGIKLIDDTAEHKEKLDKWMNKMALLGKLKEYKLLPESLRLIDYTGDEEKPLLPPVKIIDGIMFGRENIKELVIPDSVEVCSMIPCRRMKNLKRIIIGKGVTKGVQMYNLSRLEYVEIKGIMTLDRITFAFDYNLKEIKINPGFQLSSYFDSFIDLFISNKSDFSEYSLRKITFS